jgi:hypothetical protein
VTEANVISLTPTQLRASEIPRQRGPGWIAFGVLLPAAVVAAFIGDRVLRNGSSNAGAVVSAAPPPTELHCPSDAKRVPGGMARDPVTNTLARVSSFCLDIHEVPTIDYRQCVKSRLCTPPSQGVLCNFSLPDHGQHPINCVNAQQAKTFCEMAGKRLPTVIEIHWATTSGDGHSKYAWGNAEPSTQNLCWSGEINRAEIGTCEIDSHPRGVGNFGVADLEGNVAQWALATDNTIVAVGSHFASKTLEPNRFYPAKPPNPEAIGIRCATEF